MIRAEASSPKPNGIAARALAAAAHAGIPISAIRLDGGTQSRALLQDGIINEYAAALEDGASFPPVVLFYDGSDHWLADGFHRVRAYLFAGRDTIPADVRQGTRRDAILYSVGANEAHGLRRTNDDKRRAVLTLLNDAEWAMWSDREIARRCNVSDKTVASLRPVTADFRSERTYTTKHGTTATMNTSAIGKTAPEKTEPKMEVEEAEESAVDLRRGPKIVLPGGMSPVDVARQGMAREAAGEEAVAIAKSLQLSAANYRAACDVVVLSDRGGYSPADAAIVAQAMRMLLDLKIAEARDFLEPIAAKVWGKSKAPRADREQARVDQFEVAFGILLQTCATTEELDLPYLSADRAKKALRQIGAARSALQRFADRIKEIHE